MATRTKSKPTVATPDVVLETVPVGASPTSVRQLLEKMSKGELVNVVLDERRLRNAERLALQETARQRDQILGKITTQQDQITNLQKNVVQAREDREIQVRRADDIQHQYNLLARVNAEQVEQVEHLKTELMELTQKNQRLEREIGFLKDLEMQLKLRGHAAERAIRALVELVG